MIQRLSLSLVLLLAWASIALAQADYDRVYLTSGQTSLGRIENGKDKVIVRVAASTKEFPVNEVKYIQFAGEPKELMEARNVAIEKRYDDTLKLLESIPPPQRGKPEVRQEIDFYRALALARLAEGGSGDAQAAGHALIDFITANKNSYHYYEANEAIGDLLVSIGRSEQAVPYYQELAQAPWPDAKLRAGLAAGRSLAAQGKYGEAIKLFDAVLASTEKGDAIATMQMAARIGKAKALAESSQADQALKLLDDAIDQAPEEDLAMHALAYNALGDTYLRLKRPKEALYAYLHVDLLYNQSPEQHAEALGHLKTLWSEVKEQERAKAAADALKSKYPASRWSK